MCQASVGCAHLIVITEICWKNGNGSVRLPSSIIEVKRSAIATVSKCKYRRWLKQNVLYRLGLLYRIILHNNSGRIDASKSVTPLSFTCYSESRKCEVCIVILNAATFVVRCACYFLIFFKWLLVLDNSSTCCQWRRLIRLLSVYRHQ